jgi:site-specific recombinase XerD
MGTIKKIGQEYYIEFEARGLKYQQKAGTEEGAARRLLEEVEGKIKKGEMGAITRDVDADIFFNDFLQFAKQQHTPPTLKRFKSLLAHFQEFLKTAYPQLVKLSQLTPIVLEQYKIYLSKDTRMPVRAANREKAVNLSFFLLYEICQYAIKIGHLNDNPTLHIRLFKLPAGPRPRPVSGPPKEALMAELTRELQRKGPPDSEALYLQFREVLYNCGLKSGVRLAPARHTFALDLINKGMSLGVLYKYLGLSDIARAMIYAPFIPDKRRELYEGVNPHP